MRYKACSNAQKYELKPTRKIKSLFFFAFQANNPMYENDKSLYNIGSMTGYK